ncbi:hypothetical protein P5V62_16765 [Mycobacteroides abscessus subsp. massiliense]|uniref:hypothetical protein n=1 Tax=Mycobacteroides abscessus TaxID=36809 RepID=UPI0009A66988|nr:hypothetical protein [Mycobacteroides abscessus]MDO2976031.1 hypothetical protein [Mycobacteroides abscessus subsp. massiliense]SKF18876.1 Uncharacterised protein [Mycobacteroides abscessus subsp. massiliense]SKO40221.1 Uncharacterised protein [Mycobacteroides abscessus subsp. massiliense]SKY72186.1 Uncharacterised protein [Mycobacteroides abscessus subsp. massiliense]
MTFSIEPDPMMRESNRLLDAVEQSKSEHATHLGNLESAVSQMWGQSRGALQGAHAALTDQTRALHHQLTEHGAGMQEFTGQVVEKDGHNGESFGQVR